MNTLQLPFAYGGNPLDRLNNFRKNTKLMDEWLEGTLGTPTQFVFFHTLKPYLTKGGIFWWNRSQLEQLFPKTELKWEKNVFILLGRGEKEDEPLYFAVDVSQFDEKSSFFENQKGSFKELRTSTPLLSPFESSILAQARSLLDWHKRHPFCGVCGSKTQLTQGGIKRICQNASCLSPHFPRTDPVVIMLVISPKEGKCLLCRQKRWPEGMWSCLAGFMEPGETIEEACAREVKEESNIDVGKVTYVASQPWPFPSQLMIGCICSAESTHIIPNQDEVEDVQWYSRDQVTLGLERAKDFNNYQKSTEFRIPPPLAIAHQLIKHWIENY